jgi:peptidoglycan/xylan/chitin deacetylase (PgdA/CDA1 family)
MQRPFVVCIHDATPAYARETHEIIRGLAPLLGRQFSLGVVPDWHGAWPLRSHPHYCRFIRENSAELLLHGYFHRRERGLGLASLLTDSSDEMNGLNAGEAQRTVDLGQRVFTDVFGGPARGFLAPAWQRGHVRNTWFQHTLGFFAVESAERNIPLATWTWDCGRWGWLGHAGHAVGSLLHSLNGRVPVMAIHPRDLQNGFWPAILRLTRNLVDAGYQPRTVEGLLKAY